MSNTQRFSPAPPAPGSAPVPAATQSRAAPLHAQPSDEFSAAERAFFSGAEASSSEASSARESVYPERVAWLPEPTRSADQEQVDDRKRNTAKALRSVVVVRKRRLPPGLVAEDALPAQGSSGLLAVAAICCMAAVFLVCLRSSQHIETRVSAASPVLATASLPSAASDLTSVTLPAPPVTATATAMLLSAEATVATESLPTVSAPPVSSAVVPALSASAVGQSVQSAAPVHETVTSRAKPHSGLFAAKLVKPEGARKAAPPARSTSWLDTPIAPPED